MQDPGGMWERSASAWIELVRRGERNRTFILDEPMLRLAGEVKGLNVCDVGSGEGRFSRMLSDRGANVTAIEPTPSLLQEMARLGGTGVRGRAESLPFASGAFDLVVCYLVLIDVEDYREAIREMARVLAPGGRVLVANLNSFATTRTHAWVRAEDGLGLYVAVDDYFQESILDLSWKRIEIVNHHRPFEAYMQAFLEQDLRLTHFEEPRPTQESVDSNPDLEDALCVPLFHVMQWRKDSHAR